MAEWDLTSITDSWQAKWFDAGVHHAELDPARKRPTFFIHFAYPGISGYLHVGHMRGFTYTDVLARYKRMTGHDVLFPAGFHASGIPAVAFAADVKRGEKTEYLLFNGYDPARDGPIERLHDARNVVDYFAKVYTSDYWKRFGFLIDERRNCTTIDPAYSTFIQWQFRALKRLGYLVEKPHYAPFCPVAGPVAVDKSETDIKQGGSAEVLEFLALRFELDAGKVHPEAVVLPCATLRPETVFGATNVWVRADHDYRLVRVWKDGAVADTDPHEVWLVSQQGERKLEWQFERAEPLDKVVSGRDLLAHTARAPVTGRDVPIVDGPFVDPAIATGIVMSVPGHAPFDYAAYRDAGLPEDKIPQIVKVEGAPPGLPAKLAAAKHKVASQADRAALEAATEEVYADEFNKGVLTDACGPYAGKRIKGVKDQVRQDFLARGDARPIRQFSELVVSRAGERVEIKRIPDQDFIHYADKAWTEKAKAHAAGTYPGSSTDAAVAARMHRSDASHQGTGHAGGAAHHKTPLRGQDGAGMAVFPQKYKDELPNVLDWFGDRACVRRGAWLGTEFPFKPGWIVEPIADSTFYPWFYVIQRYLKSAWNPHPPQGGLRLEELTDAFYDHVLNGKGAPRSPLWSQVRDDIVRWGPVDVNLGGKEHQTVHFPVYVMNMVALLEDPTMWPRGIFVNWWVTQKAGAKISKSKGGAEPIPGAAAKYGVDPMRLYYCHVGSPHVDIEWDPDIVLDYRRHVERLTRATDEALAASGQASPIDAWLEAAFATSVRAARDAYEACDLRAAASELVYTVPEHLRWYARRGGANAALLRPLVQQWAKALCPLLPHLAEEMHARAGGHAFATTAAFPDPAEPDTAALAREEYLRAVLEDVAVVRRLANVQAVTSLAIYTTPAWKARLLAKATGMAAAAPGGKFPMGQFMGEVMADPQMRELGKAVQNYTGKLPAQLVSMPAWQRQMTLAGADEAAILRAAAPFLAAEFGVAEVQVHAADAPDAPAHPKQGVAGPFKPGIALA